MKIDILDKENIKESLVEIINTHIEEVLYDDSKIDQIYESYSKKLDSIFYHYYNLQDKIEEMLYPNESYYLLIINISKIYHLLDLGRYYLDKWYHTKGKVIRKIPKIDSEKINLNKKEYVIKEFIKLFKKNKIPYELIYNIDLYDYEKYSLYFLLCDIDKIKGNKIEEVKYIVNYTNFFYKILLQEYEQESTNN